MSPLPDAVREAERVIEEYDRRRAESWEQLRLDLLRQDRERVHAHGEDYLLSDRREVRRSMAVVVYIVAASLVVLGVIGLVGLWLLSR